MRVGVTRESHVMRKSNPFVFHERRVDVYDWLAASAFNPLLSWNLELAVPRRRVGLNILTPPRIALAW